MSGTAKIYASASRNTELPQIQSIPPGAKAPFNNRPADGAGKPFKERGVIHLDDVTSLAGVPPEAWRYRLGSRSALEWVLDQYKERKPKDPTIAEKFNTYRFSDHKEKVIDLLQRVCTVSVATMEIVDGMAHRERRDLLAEADQPLA